MFGNNERLSWLINVCHIEPYHLEASSWLLLVAIVRDIAIL